MTRLENRSPGRHIANINFPSKIWLRETFLLSLPLSLNRMVFLKQLRKPSRWTNLWKLVFLFASVPTYTSPQMCSNCFLVTVIPFCNKPMLAQSAQVWTGTHWHMSKILLDTKLVFLGRVCCTLITAFITFGYQRGDKPLGTYPRCGQAFLFYGEQRWWLKTIRMRFRRSKRFGWGENTPTQFNCQIRLGTDELPCPMKLCIAFRN